MLKKADSFKNEVVAYCKKGWYLCPDRERIGHCGAERFYRKKGSGSSFPFPLNKHPPKHVAFRQRKENGTGCVPCDV